MLHKDIIYQILEGRGDTDYEKYLDTKNLFLCQKSFYQLSNSDELMFQIIHQVEELWMKHISFTLLNILDYIQLKHSNKIITLFKRIHINQQLMIDNLSILETMSPKDYQVIRKGLGNGSGFESPGFKAILKNVEPLWNNFVEFYLNNETDNIEKIYNSNYCHDYSYLIAESLIEFDELFQNFRYKHLKLVERTIGIDTTSLKGAPVKILNKGVNTHFFPKLWEIRGFMTNQV
jgi:tryptophan 2,3-dioxygenase